jgi:predicted nucleic acid-binding protein
MILVDSSVWIDYFNGSLTRETDLLEQILGDRAVFVAHTACSDLLSFSEIMAILKSHKSRFRQSVVSQSPL